MVGISTDDPRPSTAFLIPRTSRGWWYTLLRVFRYYETYVEPLVYLELSAPHDLLLHASILGV